MTECQQVPADGAGHVTTQLPATMTNARAELAVRTTAARHADALRLQRGDVRSTR